ncbi:type II secretion system protein [Reinekea blandensis]|uniref:Type II secretory pathway pseudopilin PulG-like protein n=1 Tax=Reinekea blandensis MED297 TaxID=314283 RepID=A4BJB4_9GAMM|nr:prepilin-type N-terminal cleavage/methylation domain-containing protein [Reinekea blandensis]EAR07772.1 Type II secretory pathway pseudopilin PulG-like protein [Reinekea sp. MED297] [Reinekea blandensis MED297]
MNRNLTRNGFTLTELIMVIVILGIISAVITPLIGNKFGAVAQSTKRAYWVQQGEYAFQTLTLDLARSVPSSVFTSEPDNSKDQVVEFLGSASGADLNAARYRNRQLSGQDRLQINNDNSFDIFGRFSSAPGWVSIGLLSSTEARQDWTQAQANANDVRFAPVASVTAGTGENGSPVSNVQLNTSVNASYRFGAHSPYFRAYFFDGPVGYECDTSDGILYRVSGYTSLAIGSSFSARTATATKDRVITNLTDCEFRLLPGSAYSPPTLRIDLEIGDGNESIRLIDTIPLRNAS